MNWSSLDALESKYSAINGIIVIDVETRRVVMANTLSLRYFGDETEEISVQRTLGRDKDIQALFQQVQEELEKNLVYVIENTTVTGIDGEELLCDISFTFANPGKKFLFMTIHPNVDNKPYYMKKFIDSRSRPAFLLNVEDKPVVNHGNAQFFKSFACNKTSMKLRYKNVFASLLAEDMRHDYEKIIMDSVRQAPYGKIDVPVQTAQGETLYFYYDSQRLHQVVEDYRQNLFCLLVKQDEEHDMLLDPFDSI